MIRSERSREPQGIFGQTKRFVRYAFQGYSLACSLAMLLHGENAKDFFGKIGKGFKIANEKVNFYVYALELLHVTVVPA